MRNILTLDKNIGPQIVVWTVLVLAIVIGWLLVPATFWQYIFFLRVPILMGLLLLGLPAVAKFFLPAMLKNLFVLRGAGQLTFTILGASAASMVVILTAHIIVYNAPARFGVPQLPVMPQLFEYLLAIALASPVAITATDLSQEEIKDKRWIGFFAGILSSAVFFFAFDWIRDSLTRSAFLKHWLAVVISFLTKHSNQGYINPNNGQLTDDHINAFAFFLVLLAVYLFVFIVFKPRPVHNQREASALFYVTLLIAIASLFLGSLTFYFDCFRVSVLFFWLLISAAMYWQFKVDHFFELKKDTIQNKDKNEQLKDFKTVIDKRLQHQNQEKTLVVVCASGGGIQAAGWTAEVLTGLQDEKLLGSSFTKSIGLISAVSGGSVGTIYYLDRFSSQGYPDTEELQKIFTSATEDSLDATGWGLTYPDLWKIIGLPLFPSIFTNLVPDRGIALETDWQGEMKGSENKIHNPKTLATWREQIFRGEIPIPILNATLVEDGRRFLISPMTFGKNPEKKYVDFNTLYADYDINLVTAARLSATFPYVSPICRGRDKQVVNPNYPSYHIADGGYFDNSGFVAVLEWLNEWLKPERELNIKKVLLIQINPFPKPEPPSDKPNETEENSGLFIATLGPLQTMYQVRDPINTARNCAEVEIFQEKYNNQKDDNIEIQYFPIFFPSKKEAPEFYSKQGEYQPPLSWKLTKREKEAIKNGWIAIKDQKQIQELKKLWKKWEAEFSQ
ncbi:hypothetical protein G7B40_004205 [Aetokthonos hydrillicola Thurmond2011]|jgi:hypothetical protein|uniref:Patatin-like phospholipase family protein n=1 Tax=Aetokthonos hydrillicola Thurmond2011 TaxID=2712845 RepID=A0AAP5I315_9CYAN|nr:patatin-like phospholipase family protein [Aetokthonos hydrillicola]MBO3457483.1 patatin-like phospholipase family protein [Aetokthonos hydrillicola CCALA 1050]MBW4585995.1 hypothetical protein [Aetokthonos hydrillicola CCALA 1050]MDR9893776.1 hypothetical protein [Aetokthonos hydrillicola Thurmond2011]